MISTMPTEKISREAPWGDSRETGIPLYRFEASLGFEPIGLVPGGLRVVIPFEGRVTDGAFEGAEVKGTDYLLIRPDGVGVIDAPKVLRGPDYQIYERVSAYCLPPEGLEMPPLEALLDPGFTWPDERFAVIGSSTFNVAAETRFSELNRAVATIRGSSSFADGSLIANTDLITPAPRWLR